MIPFKTPPWRKKLIDKQYKRKDRVIHTAVQEMEAVMRAAVDYILEHYLKTGRYVAPSLQSMYGVSEGFYRDVIQQAFYSAEEEKAAQTKNEPEEKPRKSRLTKMAGSKWPIGIPKSLKGLEKIFRDKRFWPAIMKRSKKITDRVRREYLRKLQIRFDKIVPDLDTNAITPAEAKVELMKAWDASKPRVELIFRTETTTYFGKTQVSFFNGDPEIIGFLFDSIRDTSRTTWCKSRHGLIYKPDSTGINGLAYNTPAIHYNCRSHLIPLADNPHNREMVADPKRDPERRSVTPLPPGWRN